MQKPYLLKLILVCLCGCLWVGCTSPDPTPTTSPSPTTPSNLLTLLEPAESAILGIGFPVILKWQPAQPLASNQLYSLRLATPNEPLQEILWTADPFFDLGERAQTAGDYQWQVLLIELDDDGAYRQTLAESPVWQFTVPSNVAELMAGISVNLPEELYPCSVPRDPEAPVAKRFAEYDLNPANERMDAQGQYYNDSLAFGTQTFPYFVGVYALSALMEWCTNADELGLKVAFHQAQWLLDHATYGDGFVAWKYEFPHKDFAVPAGWVSGLGNATILDFFSELYTVTQDPQYLTLTQQIVASYAATVDEGGLQALMPDGTSVFFEEVAYPNLPSGHILNGHLSAVMALWRYAERFDDQTARELAQLGVQSTRAYLPIYDVETISLYALGSGAEFSSNREHYAHGLHVSQLYWLYQETGEPDFLKYAFRWAHDGWNPYGTQLYLNDLSAQNTIDYPLEGLPSREGYYINVPATRALLLDLGEILPIGSFAYDVLNHVHPTDYSLSASEDGETWTELAQEKDYQATEGLYRFEEEISARYLKLAWSAWSAEVEWVTWGLTRVDTPDYWRKPIFLVGDVDGNLMYAQDLQPESPLAVTETAVIYADLQTSLRPTLLTFLFSPNTDKTEWNLQADVSNDLVNWESLWAEPQRLLLPNSVALPAPAEPWQYLRLTLSDGTGTLNLDGIIIEE